MGKLALLGIDALDYWNQRVNERVLQNELKKMTPEEKRQLAESLLAQAQEAEVTAEKPLAVV